MGIRGKAAGRWARGLLYGLGGSETTRARAIVFSGLIFSFLMVALCALSLYESREDTAQNTVQSLRAVALISERDISRNFELYSLSLQGVIDGLKEPDFQAMSPHLRRMMLFDHAATADYLGSILVTDAHGVVIHDSDNDVPRPADLSDRDYFKVHVNNPDVGLFVSEPFKSRFGLQDTSIALSRRVTHPDGSFAGIVTIAVRLSYFHDLFAGLALGRHGSMALINTNGTLIMRQPYDPDMIGRRYNRVILEQNLSNRMSGTINAAPQIDGIKRLYAFRQFSNLPLLVMVGAAEVDVYANWERRAWFIGTLMALLATGFVGLSFMLSIQLRRRLRAEAELRLLARTDVLTGLNNRRTLGEILDSEWRHALRSGQVFSLLFIDLDHFKAYNDHYGHLAGDDVLAAVAHCIRDNLRLSTDSVARYGGEEFVAVLPGTGAVQAALVAAKVLSAVSALAIPHAGSQYGHVTVSIGSASWNASRYSNVSDLIKAADTALYGAKAAGRNTAVAASV